MPTYTAGLASDNSGAGAGSAISAGVPNVSRTCVANVSANTDGGAGGTTTTFGAVTWNIAATAYTNWWCSNGLYKKVKSTSANDGSLNTT